MTIKELYEIAVKNKFENYNIFLQYQDGGGTYFGDKEMTLLYGGIMADYIINVKINVSSFGSITTTMHNFDHIPTKSDLLNEFQDSKYLIGESRVAFNKSIKDGRYTCKRILRDKTCQDCKNCKIDNDLHHSYLYCELGTGDIDKDISTAMTCKCFK